MNFEDIKLSIKDFSKAHSKIIVAILGILLFFILSAMILLVVQALKGSKNKAPYKATEPITSFNPEDDFLQPQNTSLTEDYYFSRSTEENWSNEEAKDWFTPPDDMTMNELRKANDALVDQIVGVAP